MRAKILRMIENPRRQWRSFKNPDLPPVELLIWAAQGRATTRRLFERNILRKPDCFDTVKRLTFVDISKAIYG